MITIYVYLVYYKETRQLLKSTSSVRSSSLVSEMTYTVSSATLNSTTIPYLSSSVGRRPDDGVWFDYSDAPSLLFYAYSAFVDDRPSGT